MPSIMRIWQRFKRLTPWNKISVIGSVVTAAGFVIAFYFWLAPRYLPPIREMQSKSNAPLDVQGFVSPVPPYAAGENVGGILWMENFVDVRFRIRNTHKSLLRDLDLEITLDTFIADAKQIGNVVDIRLIPNSTDLDIWFAVRDTNGKPKGFAAIPPQGMSLPLMTSTLRVHCPLLLGGTSAELLLASVALNPPKTNGGLPDTLFAPNRRVPTTMRVHGTYLDDQQAPALRYKVDNTIHLE